MENQLWGRLFSQARLTIYESKVESRENPKKKVPQRKYHTKALPRGQFILMVTPSKLRYITGGTRECILGGYALHGSTPYSRAT